MSVLLQPYQALPFSNSLDFQTRYKENCDNCSFENIIALNTFIPFAILSADFLISDPVLYGCDNEKIQDLTMSFTSTLNEDTGLWFHYYDGADLGLSCGTYYITILVGDFIWYSEMFTIKDISSDVYPELIKDDFHLPLRIYDNITKQLANKCDVNCNVAPLNPVSTIMPFMFYTPLDICSLNIFLVNVCTLEETDLTADLELEFIKQNPGAPIIVDVNTTSQQIRNENYYFDKQNYIFQEFTIQDEGTLYSFTFEWLILETLYIEIIKGTNPSAAPVASYILSPISTEVTIDLFPDNISVIPGDIYIIKIYNHIAPCTLGVSVSSTKLYPDGRFGECNFLGQFKDEISCQYDSAYVDGQYKIIRFAEISGRKCYGTLSLPNTPLQATYSYKYTATEDQIINISTSNFAYHIGNTPATIAFVLLKNSDELYRYDLIVNSINDYLITDFSQDLELINGDEISLRFDIYSGNDSAQYFISGNVDLKVYNYGELIDGVYNPSGLIPLGITYQNKSLWFNCMVRKLTYTCGTGTTKIYNPGRVLPSPLICGNYYLRMTDGINEWFSEWFKVINVGFVELTRYLLGTENDKIISGDDDVEIEI